MARVLPLGFPNTGATKGDADLVTEIADARALVRIAEPWRRLSDCAAEPNVFYDPDFALPAIAALGLEERVHALLVWEGGERRVLAGIFPFVTRWRWGFPLGVAEALVHPYGPLSTPLVAAGRTQEVLSAFARWVAAGDGPRAWLFRLMPQDGEVAERLCAALRGEDLVLQPFAAHGRAVLDTADCNAAEIETAISSRHRKELRRQARRLADYGPVALDTAQEPDAVARGVEEFLDLEAAGWKGRRGTAAKLGGDVAAMFRILAPALAARRACRVERLMVDGRPVAVAISLGSGEQQWLWKIAYDEAFAPLSPGVQLVQALTARALGAGGRLRIDSCALPGIAMIERLWPQRRPYCDLLVVPARWGALARLATVAEGERRDMEHALRWMRRRIGAG